MAKWILEATLQAVLDEIEKSDEEAVCNTQPATYFNAIHPDLWVAETTYVAGDTARPPTDNNFVYECTVGGTTGTVEPGWTTTQDSTFTDGTVTWKAHENYSLANTPLVEGDKTRGAGSPSGFKLTVAEIMGITTHRAGTVTHTALLEHAAKKLHHVTTASTTLAENNDVEAGRTTIFHELEVQVRVLQ